jgi:hypothetical protein
MSLYVTATLPTDLQGSGEFTCADASNSYDWGYWCVGFGANGTDAADCECTAENSKYYEESWYKYCYCESWFGYSANYATNKC